MIVLHPISAEVLRPA